MRYFFKNNTIIAFANEPESHNGEAFQLHLDLRAKFPVSILSYAQLKTIENDEDYETGDDLDSYVPASVLTAYNAEKLKSLKAEKEAELQSNIATAYNTPIKVLAGRDVYLRPDQERIDNMKNLKEHIKNEFEFNGLSTVDPAFEFDQFDHNAYDGEGNIIELTGQTVTYLEILEIIKALGDKVLSLRGQGEAKKTLLANASTESDYNNLDLSIS